MISALVYLQYHSIRNRLIRQFQRLKQPKYFIFAVVGVLYFTFYVNRWRMVAPNSPTAGSAGDRLLYQLIGAAALFLIVFLAWIMPHERAALAFTEAEVAFLFPAPISRRGLIHFKLLRSQTAILFTTFFLMLVTNRFGGKFWIHAGGWWIILSTLNLHMLGCSFARTLLLDRGITNWQRRLAIGGLLSVLAVVVIVWGWRTFPGFAAGQLDSSSSPVEMM